MRLLGFNTGRIRPQTIDGEVVRTAYVKSPVPEPWILTPTGPEGNEVAAHSDHLYAFDHAAYEHWAAELGVDRASWPDGHFAENLTLDAIDQSALRIGDRFRLGTATIVVTGPRVPCWKLTWRLGQPKSFMRRFRLSGRSGSYFGVLEPGRVHPGDELELIGREEGAPTVAELSALCDSGTRITAEGRALIDRALANPHLSPTVRGTLELKVAGIAREAESSGAGWPGWRAFDLGEAVRETADATSYRLRPSDGGELPPFRPGQHVAVRLTEPDGRRFVRTWSLSDWEEHPAHYRITVKRLPAGRGGAALARLTAGDERATLELRAPAGHFHLDRGTFRPVVLVAAGIGITPMVAMIRAHLARGADMPPLWLLYGARDPGETAFRSELDELFARHPDLHLHYYLSRPEQAPSASSAATVHHGRLSAERVIQLLRGNYLRVADGPVLIPWFESDIYLCGPEAFNDGVREGLVAAGANPDLVRVEDFAGATGEPVTPQRDQDAEVVFASRDRRTAVPWRWREEQTLLELAEESGLEPPYDCRAGTCRTCESTLVQGEVDGSTSVFEDGSRRVLLCVSYPRSDHVVIEPSVVQPPSA